MSQEGWNDDLRFYIILIEFHSNQKVDNENLCAVEPHLQFERFVPPEGLIHRTARTASD